jgi:hypothetical protein
MIDNYREYDAIHYGSHPIHVEENKGAIIRDLQNQIAVMQLRHEQAVAILERENRDLRARLDEAEVSEIPPVS